MTQIKIGQRLWTQEQLTLDDFMCEDGHFCLVRTAGELPEAKLVAICLEGRRGSSVKMPPQHEAESNAILFAFANPLFDVLAELVLLQDDDYIAPLPQDEYEKRCAAAWQRARNYIEAVTKNEKVIADNLKA